MPALLTCFSAAAGMHGDRFGEGAPALARLEGVTSLVYVPLRATEVSNLLHGCGAPAVEEHLVDSTTKR